MIPEGLSNTAEIFVAAVLLLAAINGNKRLEKLETRVEEVRLSLVAAGIIRAPNVGEGAGD